MNEGAGARSFAALVGAADRVARKSAVSVGTGAAVVTEATAGVGACAVCAELCAQGTRARKASRTRTVAEVFISRISMVGRPEGNRPLPRSKCRLIAVPRLSRAGGSKAKGGGALRLHPRFRSS